MKIAICDDQPIMCKEINTKLKQYAEQKHCAVDTLIFHTGKELLSSKFLFDIVFLDIELENENGIEIAESYRMEHKGRIIFLTSHIEEMPNGYKVRAFRFLVKPINEALFYEAMDSAVQEIVLDKPMIVQEDGKDILIHLSDIIYIEAGVRSCGVRTSDGFHRCGMNIEAMKRELSLPNFYETHRSYIVNMDYIDIRSVKGNSITMYNGEIVKISRLKEKSFRDAYFEYIRSK